MKRFALIISLLTLLTLVSCQSDIPIPTLAQLPTQIPTQMLIPTTTATTVPTLTQTTTPTPLPTATITNTPGILISISLTPSDTPIPQPPTATATPLPSAFIFGQSALGSDLTAYRYGTGQHLMMLVGGIHAGYEANTVDLLHELRAHYASHPQDIAPAVTLLLIPALNPDGLARGRSLNGRFNGNGVDLNRNWACGWSATAVFDDLAVNPGAQPFSEPETTALGSLIQRLTPAAVLFYHAAANGVFSGGCAAGKNVSSELAALYGTAAGYPFGADFAEYTVTGSAPAWVDSLGIPAADIELATADGVEFNRNFQAIQAVQQWLINR
jgi:Zinc carboxypeptidase